MGRHRDQQQAGPWMCTLRCSIAESHGDEGTVNMGRVQTSVIVKDNAAYGSSTVTELSSTLPPTVYLSLRKVLMQGTRLVFGKRGSDSLGRVNGGISPWLHSQAVLYELQALKTRISNLPTVKKFLQPGSPRKPPPDAKSLEEARKIFRF
ncbi:hypothetical protein H8959_010205 [Pygathrix nigripes]